MLRSLTVKSPTFAGALGALALAGAWPAQAAERVDCRYYRTDELRPSMPGEGPGPLETMLLPDNDVFRPILADQREPRFYADYRRLHFRGANQLSEGHGDDINVGMVAFGGQFGIWGLRQRRGCDGLQVSLFGVVFAQFNLDTPSMDLLNSDYLVGPVLTYRQGPWSGRLRFYHQSSHLGDEFLLNYGIASGVQRQNLSVEVLDLLVSLEDSWWRLFAGGGIIVFSDKQEDLSSTPGFVNYGVELRGPAWGWRNSTLRPVFGGFLSQLQATGWSLSGSLEGGLEWSAPGSAHRVRALVVAQRGALPFSQFFTDRTQSFGLQMQFEF